MCLTSINKENNQEHLVPLLNPAKACLRCGYVVIEPMLLVFLKDVNY